MLTRRSIWSIILTAIAVVALAASASAAESTRFTFPLKISDNGRHLVDQKRVPFFIHGDSPWSLIVQLSKADTKRYLDRIQGLGYNAIVLNVLEHKFADNPPLNHDGQAPLSAAGDFSTPNPAYFDHAAWVFQQAAERGILVIAFHAYVGHRGGPQGWWRELSESSPEKCRLYGEFLGDRFKDVRNLIWMDGGDWNVPANSPGENNMLEILRGMHDRDPSKLRSYHGGRGKTAMDQESFAAHMDLDAVYAGDDARGPELTDQAFVTSLRAYNRQPPKPHFFLEGIYENTLPEKPKWGDPYTSDRARLRRQAYWAILCGATGHCFGNFPVWPLLPGWDGPHGLGSPANRDMQYLKAVFTAHPWWKLVPDQDHKIVTAEPDASLHRYHVAGARADDGSLIIAYFPSSGTQSRTATVDMATLEGAATARWFNPADGTSRTIGDAPLPNLGSRKFATPGDNGTGSNDWLLVLEVQ